MVAFDALYHEFESTRQTRLAHSALTRKTGTPRQRQPGAGRKFQHTLRDRLLLALFWLRVYPTLEVLGFFFSLDKTSAEDNLKDLLATLETMVCFALEHPDKNRRKLRTIDQVMDAFPEVALVLDAKEQRIECPKNKTASPDMQDASPCACRPRRGRAETLLFGQEEVSYAQNPDWGAPGWRDCGRFPQCAWRSHP